MKFPASLHGFSRKLQFALILGATLPSLLPARYTTSVDTMGKRRTRIYYAPRTWRLSLTANF